METNQNQQLIALASSKPLAYCDLKKWKSGLHLAEVCFSSEPGEGLTPVFDALPVSEPDGSRTVELSMKVVNSASGVANEWNGITASADLGLAAWGLACWCAAPAEHNLPVVMTVLRRSINNKFPGRFDALAKAMAAPVNSAEQGLAA